MLDRTRNTIVGLTSLLGLAGLFLLLVLFGYVPSWIKPGYKVVVEMQQAGGINSASRARLNGIDIGRVREIELLQAPKRGILLTLEVNGDVRIPKAAPGRVSAPLLGGSPTFVFTTAGLSDEQMADILPVDGTAQIVADESDAGSMAGAFAKSISDSVDRVRGDMKVVIERFERVQENFQALSEEWTKVGQNVNQMIEPRKTAEVDAGTAAPNVSTLLARADARMKELEAAIAGINDLLGDQKLRDDMRQTVGNARKATENLAAAAASAKTTSDNLNENVDRIAKRVVAVADDLSATIASARKAMDQAGEGQGTIGKMLNDPALYDNLNDAAERIGKAADEVKLLIDKWKAEGVPVKF